MVKGWKGDDFLQSSKRNVLVSIAFAGKLGRTVLILVSNLTLCSTHNQYQDQEKNGKQKLIQYEYSHSMDS